MFRTIQYIGNQELLKRRKTLFVCSKRAPMATYERIFGWVESLSAWDKDDKTRTETEKNVVICCDTTELEQEVMKSLLVNEVPTILVVMNRFRDENNVQIQKALAEERLLIVVMQQTDKKRWSPRDRNFHLINQVADHIVGGYIDKYGSLFPLLVGLKKFEALTHNLVSDIAAEPDNLYQRWTVGEDKTLLRMYYEDMGIHEIKKKLGRTYAAIRQRIRAITMPEDVLKGREFEEFVLELLDVKNGKLLLKEWRGDKTLGEVSPENNSYPDFIVEEVETKRCIAIECKWRQKLTPVTMMELFASESLITYRQFSEENRLPVFIVLGIGGIPCEPDTIYIIPLEKASFEFTPSKKDPSKLVCEPSQLNAFKRATTDAPLCMDEFCIDNSLPPSLTSKEKQLN